MGPDKGSPLFSAFEILGDISGVRSRSQVRSVIELHSDPDYNMAGESLGGGEIASSHGA